MRLLICLVVLVLSITSMPAAAQTSVPYDLASAPVAHRDKVIEADGGRIYTAPNGWYTIALRPRDVPSVDGGLKSVFRGLEDDGEHRVLVTLGSRYSEDGDTADTMSEAQASILSLTTPPPSFEGLSDIDYRLLDLGGDAGKIPVRMTLWYADGVKMGYPTQGMGFIPVPRGTIIVLLLTDNKAEAEAMLIESLRVGEGVLE